MNHAKVTTEAAALPLVDGGVLLLLRLRWRTLQNALHQAMRERPMRLLGSAASVGLIWGGLYVLLLFVFREIKKYTLESIVATPLIFTFFFLALTCMLAFSNAILCYGGLFRRQESAYLLAGPLPVRDVVIVRYLESLLLSSWSLVLLGVPLMLAVGSTFDESPSFYPLFIGLFLLFIPLPGAIGLFMAWLIVMIAPKTPKRTMGLLAVFLVTAVGLWVWQAASVPVTSQAWIRSFFDRISIARHALLPSTWVANGINHALQGQPGDAGFYLFVTLANALFVSVLAVGVVSRWFVHAFGRAQVSNARNVRRSGVVLAWIAEVIFAYLPRQQRLLACKDLKTFFRDPLQWSQMAILFALLPLYVGTVQGVGTDMAEPKLQLLIAFLNLTAVSLILATFTSRFVFPLLSLEGQQLWLLGLLPLQRRRLVSSKFLYSLTITLLTASAVMGVSMYRLELPGPMVVTHVIASAAICVGLCGVSVGMGARMPVFTERNPARIAGGFGGTVSLLMSVALVVASLACVGLMSLREIEAGLGGQFSASMFVWLSLTVLINMAAAGFAMRSGVKHFNRVEW